MLNFEKFLEHNVTITDGEKQELVSQAQGFNSQEDAEKELNDILNTDYPYGYKNIPDEMTLYRIIFIGDESGINEDELGRHWVMDKDLIDNDFIKKIRETSDAVGEPHIIKGIFDAKGVDWKETLHNNMQFPREYEVTAGDLQPLQYKIYTLEEFT